MSGDDEACRPAVDEPFSFVVELPKSEDETMAGAAFTRVEEEGGGATSSSSESEEGKKRSGSDLGFGEDGGSSLMFGQTFHRSIVRVAARRRCSGW